MGFNSGFKGLTLFTVDCVWNMMSHAQKPDFVFRLNGRVHLNRPGEGGGGGHFIRLLAGELYTSACRVCTARASLCSAVMWRLLATCSILLFPLHFSRASPCAITFQTQSTTDDVSFLRAFNSVPWKVCSTACVPSAHALEKYRDKSMLPHKRRTHTAEQNNQRLFPPRLHPSSKKICN